MNNTIQIRNWNSFENQRTTHPHEQPTQIGVNNNRRNTQQRHSQRKHKNNENRNKTQCQTVTTPNIESKHCEHGTSGKLQNENTYTNTIQKQNGELKIGMQQVTKTLIQLHNGKPNTANRPTDNLKTETQRKPTHKQHGTLNRCKPKTNSQEPPAQTTKTTKLKKNGKLKQGKQQSGQVEKNGRPETHQTQ